MIASSSSFPKPAVQSRIFSWPEESSIQQNFSLPSSIIYYISKNPSTPTVYLKLAQSCKYFFEKLPILVANNIYDEHGETILCDNDEHPSEDKCSCCVNIDIAKLSCHLWLTNMVNVYGIYHSNFASLLLPKLYQSDIIRFHLVYQRVKFDDFKFITSSAKKVKLIDVKMFYADGNHVTLDAILEALANIEKFDYVCNPTMFDFSTLKNITKLQNLSNLRELGLYDIPEAKEADDILNVIKKLKAAKIRLYFHRNISEEFKNQMNVLVDTVLEDRALKCVIRYNGQNEEKLGIMQERFG